MDLTSWQTFQASLSSSDRPRRERLAATADTDLRRDLLRDGVAIVRGALHPEDWGLLARFQSIVEQALGGVPDCGGYIDVAAQPVPGGIQITGARLNRTEPNHGQVRLQTKGMHFPMPGFEQVARHPLLRETFAWWHGDGGDVTRGTMEWIIPAAMNHNGWHKDTVRPQLKAFILLGEVDESTAPMYFARGSHLCSTPFESEVARRLTQNGTSRLNDQAVRTAAHYPAVVGMNYGYLGDDEAPNAPTEIGPGSVSLGGTEYELAVCTGSPGDVVFFDSCGFHSGNRSHKSVRRTIALSSPGNGSELGTALSAAGHPGV